MSTPEMLPLEVEKKIIEYVRTTHGSLLRAQVERLSKTDSIRVWVEGLLDISHEKVTE